MLLALDTETTGVPLWSYPDPTSRAQLRAWPRLVSVAWQVVTKNGRISPEECIAKPEGFVIPESASRIHGISQQKAVSVGKPLEKILDTLLAVIKSDTSGTVVIAAYNCEFDYGVLVSECTRTGHALGALLQRVEWQCIMRLVKQVGSHKRHLNLKSAVQIYAPNFYDTGFHTAAGDVTAMVTLMLAIAKLEKNGKR